VYSNFVTSIDGVVALGATPSAGSVISGRNPADRFLMGLLRACADAVLIGAGTLRATPGHYWTPQHVYPDFALAFAELRSTLGLKPEPRLVVFTRGGDIDASHPAIRAGATILTTTRVGRATSGRLPDSCDLIEVGNGEILDMPQAIGELMSRGYEILLTEGGPHLMGALIAGRCLDEVFLTLSPVIAGRDRDSRLGMVAGVELLPGAGVWSRLLSLRRHGDYLFLRYALPKADQLLRSRARPGPLATS